MKCKICGTDSTKNICFVCATGEQFRQTPINEYLQNCHFGARTARIVEKVYNDSHHKKIDQENSIFLFGSPGTGKTVYAGICFYSYALNFFSNKKYFNKRAKLFFVSALELLLEIKQTYQNNESESEIIERFKNYDVLVIDDLGVEKTTDWALSMLYLIISYRYENFKTTIFTSNYSLPQLTAKMNDSRIPSRIGGWCEIIEFNGKDKRQS